MSVFDPTASELAGTVNCALPPLSVALSDDQGKQLSGWTFTLDRSTIAPGETIVFKTEGKNPPPGATKLHVTFAGAN